MVEEKKTGSSQQELTQREVFDEVVGGLSSELNEAITHLHSLSAGDSNRLGAALSVSLKRSEIYGAVKLAKKLGIVSEDSKVKDFLG